MSVSNLTNTTWEFNSTVSYSSVNFNINFTSNNTDYIKISIEEDDGDAFMNYYISQSNSDLAGGGYSGFIEWWENDAYKTISITGGTDVTNSTLISWLEANATQVETGTTYEHILKNGNKVQVDSAIRDGEGVKISTNYAKKSELPTVPTNVSSFTNDSGYITGISSSDVTTALGYTPVNPSSLGTASSKNTGTSSGNVPVLDSNGKLASSVVPAIAITDTFVVASQNAMLGLSNADVGDVAVRTDLNKSFILKATPYSTLSNWQELLTPTDAVTSVNGKTGAVSLSASDVGALASNTSYVSSVNGNTGAITNIATTSDIPTSINGLSGGSLTSPLVIYGGDASGQPKLSLDNTRAGQITDSSTSTLFGFLSNNTGVLTVGGSGYALGLRGSETRPKYNGNYMAMYGDIPDTSGKENTSNKVTSLSSSSTDTQYPSAKCVYDMIGDIETLLTTLNSGNGV